jgi:hypothetical protein
MSSRLAGVPLDHVAAEIAAFPLAKAGEVKIRGLPAHLFARKIPCVIRRTIRRMFAWARDAAEPVEGRQKAGIPLSPTRHPHFSHAGGGFSSGEVSWLAFHAARRYLKLACQAPLKQPMLSPRGRVPASSGQARAGTRLRAWSSLC